MRCTYSPEKYNGRCSNKAEYFHLHSDYVAHCSSCAALAMSHGNYDWGAAIQRGDAIKGLDNYLLWKLRQAL